MRRPRRGEWRSGAVPVVQRIGVEMNYPVYTAEHKRRAAELRADGLTYPAIACAMGITHVTTVQRWLTGGVQPRGARADTYVSGRVCVECGSPRHRTARGTRCVNCQKRETLHRNAIDGVVALRAWAAEHGEPPTIEEWVSAGLRPIPTTLVRTFGSWSEALRAAGLDPRERQNTRRDGSRP
jgi:hypothetical protein